MRKYLLPQEGTFYKANLHAHTTMSDGAFTPEAVKELYKKLGYSVVAFTDHDIFLDSQHLTDDTFLALNAVEYSSTCDGEDFIKPQKSRRVCHFNAIAKDKTNLVQPIYHRTKYFNGKTPREAKDRVVFDLNVPDFEKRYSPECINEMMRICKEKGFFVTYNHPSWSLERYPDYIQYKYIDAIEIYNGECIMCGYPNSSIEYDDFLRKGMKISCVGGDDCHLLHADSPVHCDAGRAYTMIKAKELTYEAIIDAMVKGEMYASEGPEIYELYYEDEHIHIKTSDCDRITMSIAGRRNVNVKDEGNGLNSASFKVLPEDGYVRITVCDKYRMTASTRAFFVEDLVK